MEEPVILTVDKRLLMHMFKKDNENKKRKLKPVGRQRKWMPEPDGYWCCCRVVDFGLLLVVGKLYQVQIRQHEFL